MPVYYQNQVRNFYLGSTGSLGLMYYGNVEVNYGIVTPSTDPDAQAFINATGISGIDATAINSLVLDLKSYGLWSTLYALYPFVGGTSDTCKYNLVNPTDSDAAYRITYRNVGNLTFSSNGVQNASSTNNTGMISNFNLISASVGYSWSAGVYGGVANPGGLDLGVWTGGGSNSSFYLSGNAVSANIGLTDCFSELDVRILVGGQSNGGTGFTQVSRLDNTLVKLYRNGSTIGSNGATAIYSPPSWPIAIGGNFYQNSNIINDVSSNQFRTVYFASGYTDTQVANMYTCVETFNTTLGRNS